MANAYVKHPTRYKWVWRQLHGFFILWSVVYNAVLAAVLFLGIPAEAVEDRWEIIILQVVPAFFLNHTIFFGGFLYRIQQRPFPVAVQSFVVGALTIGLNIYFIACLQLGYMGWFYSGFIGGCASFTIYVYPVYWQEKLWPILNFKWYRLKSSLRVSLPSIPHHLSVFLLDVSDRLVMDVLRVPVQRIGLYNIASSFGLYFSAASYAVVQAASPMYMQIYASTAAYDSQLKIRRVTFTLQGLFLVTTSLLSLWMKEIFQLLIKNDVLQQAYPLAIIILMGYNYKPMHLVVESRLFYQERTEQLWKISFVAGVGNVILNLLLIPLFGIEAAAFTTFVSLMYTGYSGFLLKSFKQSQLINFYPVVSLALTVALLLGIYFIADRGILFKVMISIVVLVAGVIFFVLINKKRCKVNTQ
ncbi:lipopolysaccharide biosynthesis protein [Pontibacter korlensis]|nr:lipopolysaccharide biosynthesis protein [Pontibacter korlensis]